MPICHIFKTFETYATFFMNSQTQHEHKPSEQRVRHRVLDLVRHPGQWFTRPAAKHYYKKYHGKYKYARAIFALDTFLIGIALGLGIMALTFAFYRPTSITDKVIFEATVAPREITSGAPSTLIIRWTNLTGKELKNAKLLLGYPDHFLLQEVTTENDILENGLIDLGKIPIDGSGQIKIQGVMFGDVGGEQTFRSIFSFQYSEDGQDKHAQKIEYYRFTPVASTLNLSLALPERLVAYQEVTGTITYKNTGEIDFPKISIQPEWPDDFILLSSDPALEGGSWDLPAIKAGAEGTMEFTGRLDSLEESATFIFHPSFTFGKTRYRQDTLSETVPFIPPPLGISHSIDSNTIIPGGLAEITVRYENTSEFTLSNIEILFKTDSPFFSKTPYGKVSYSDGMFSYTDPENSSLQELAPDESGEITFALPIRRSIHQSEIEVYENISTTSKAGASYVLGDETPQRITSFGSEISTSVTSPIIVESFGRYTSPQGDQLGRGPLPPIVGEETKYWIFVNLRGTTNPIENVSVEAELASGVRLTGKQTVSVGEPIEYDPDSNTVSWSAERIEPTFPPGSKVVGLAFEVGITPTEAQIGTSPVLLSNVRITGRDAVTGEFVSGSGSIVSTDLPFDTMAAGLGTVETW